MIDAGFATVFWGGRPAEGQEGSPQGYLLAQTGSADSGGMIGLYRCWSM